MKKKGFILVAIITLLLISNVAFGVSSSTLDGTVYSFGLWSLLPPIIAILLAFITKNVIISLFIGILSGTILLNLNGADILGTITNGFLMIINIMLGSLADSWNAGIILQCLAIGGLIALISKMGGAKAISEKLAKKANSSRSAQLITWVLGLLVFFDDYSNALIVGPIMRPVTDKMKISREKLAFIIDATAAPIAGIALISTWIGYELSLIKDGYSYIGQEVNAYNVFLETIPFRFYNILILIFIVATAIFLREFGPMLKAEMRALKTGKLLGDNAKPMISSDTSEIVPDEDIKLSVWNAIIPIGMLIISSLVGFYHNGYLAIMGGENIDLITLLQNSPVSLAAIRETFGASDASIVLFQSAILSTIVAIIMGVVQKLFTLEEAIDTWIQGIKSLVITAVILILAWSLSSVVKELGTSTYLASILSDAIPKFLLPSIIFILGAVISFATGTSWGTMGILMPLTIPVAFAISPENSFIVLSISGVLTGSIFGDHCSPISDTTILASMGAACDHVDHTKTQLYYAVSVALVAILLGYIPAALGMPIYLVLPISIIAIISIVYFIGKPVKDQDLETVNIDE
ncbi:MAG: Na+/H+ antiporter NhaC family protein [Firmicutes bacterium]|nr:Na+/H+ antiporter NhaC family protein [Bacillota bacterium]